MSILGAIGKFVSRKANDALAKSRKQANIHKAYKNVGKQRKSRKKINGHIAYKNEKKRLDQITEKNRRDVEKGINDI